MISGSIIASVVSWNSATTIALCLDSLLKQGADLAKIVVYDNASSDETRAILSSYASRVEVIYGAENIGFCGGHNTVLQQTDSDFVLLVNPDVVLTAGYIRRGVSVMRQDDKIGTVCGLLLQSPDGRMAEMVDGTGLSLMRSRRFVLRDHGRLVRDVHRSTGEVFGSDGALPLLRRAMINDIAIDGLFFDPTFFAHKEDHDVAWRARLFGWKTVFEPACIAYHPRVFRPGDLSVRRRLSSDIKFHAVKNDLLMLLKNEPFSGFIRDFFSIVPRRLAIAAYSLLAERSSLAAYPYIARRFGAVMRQRRQIQSRARVSAKEIRRWHFAN